MSIEVEIKQEAPHDVIIIGAGLSGIGCAARLSKDTDKNYLILERRDQMGGTWDLFKYPGIRSDSDLFTFGYDFRPWMNNKCIAPGADIKTYIEETAREYNVVDHIRFGCTVQSINWNSTERLWSVRYSDKDTGIDYEVKAHWVFGASGYYDYDKGHRPSFPQEERFQGKFIHPQHWPEDYDHSGERIAIIGSGATAVTLLPSLTDTAEHVYQVQRTPTYILPIPGSDALYGILKTVIGKKLAYKIMRAKYITRQALFFQFCRRFPKLSKSIIRFAGRRGLPKQYPYDEHFTPPYDPWDQRLCAVPDMDFFNALSENKASIVTGHIENFTETGILMKDGQHIEVDTVITATGLTMKLFADIDMRLDGKPIIPREHIVYKGMMLDGIPNFCFAVGYTNSSWTLKVGLLCQQFLQILKIMDEKDSDTVVAVRPDHDMELRPLMDFGAGYVQRVLDDLPKQGNAAPWQMSFSYFEDVKAFKKQKIDDGILTFEKVSASEPSTV